MLNLQKRIFEAKSCDKKIEYQMKKIITRL